MKTSICLGLTLLCLAVQSKELQRNVRAVGALTLSDYDTKFTSDSKQLLRVGSVKKFQLKITKFFL